ncbi:g8563 [Coccomyxa viridis]|uniref:G8563 protein n=1 Tax=Coccomyxa viridis TaxID=1274662 RepID=A0ABP1G727_9CHLO
MMTKGVDLFRSKGILAIQGSDDKHFFQGVHMLLSFGSSAEGIGEPWKEGELRKNRIVFIGRNLDRAELERDFKACLVKK